MIIGFDIQALQTENSKGRGIGRYTGSLIRQMTAGPGNKDNYVLFYNTRYDTPSIPESDRIRMHPVTYGTQDAQDLVQFLQYMASGLDILHVHSPFEGYPSSLPVISTHLSRLNCAVCATVYDLIPLGIPDYFEDPSYEDAYYRQLRTLYNCDFILAISENTRHDVINRLGISPDSVVNMGGAPDGRFCMLDDGQKAGYASLKKKFGIRDRFVLYTGGIDARKNIEGSIRAFSMLDKSILDDTSYVIVCRIQESDRRRLQELAASHGIPQNLVLTGHIPDADLNILYNCCTVYMFPSIMEGFGLPIAEAMACGAPVIASNTSCMPELVGDAQFLFDPRDAGSMASLLSQMLTDEQLRARSASNSRDVASHHSWDAVASRAYGQYLESAGPRKPALKRPRVAMFAPMPPTRSGVADYAAFMLPFWSRFWDVDVFVDQDACGDPYVSRNYRVYPYTDFEEIHSARKYDHLVYHFGNSEYHAYMFEMLYRFGGTIILHDVYLSGIIHWMTAAKGNTAAFESEVEHSHGEHGRKMIERAGRGLVPWDRLIWDLHMNRRVVDSALHVIVHSEWDRDTILESYPHHAGRISVVPHFCRPLLYAGKGQHKDGLGLAGRFVICTFGFIVATKKLGDILAGLRDALLQNPDWLYILVGDTADPHAQDVRDIIERHGLSAQVRLAGFVADSEYQEYLKACDIAIQLRQDIRGGGSGTISRAMGAGIPTIVSDTGPFAEIPDGTVIKLKPGSEGELGRLLSAYYNDPQKRDTTGRAARDYATSKLSCMDCARMHAEVVSGAGQTQ